MPFDYKKEYKEYYMPPTKPIITLIPSMNYLAIRGTGNPNTEDGDYQKAIGLLYGVAYTLKMSHKSDYKIKGFFEYVVPPLEGFWWNEKNLDTLDKDYFHWISLIRLPDFITKSDFDWAIVEATKKKKLDFTQVEFLTYDEGLCVVCMHIGSYDSEPATILAMEHEAHRNGYQIDINSQRFHHEIYLSDPRKGDNTKTKTVIRHPIK